MLGSLWNVKKKLNIKMGCLFKYKSRTLVKTLVFRRDILRKMHIFRQKSVVWYCTFNVDFFKDFILQVKLKLSDQLQKSIQQNTIQQKHVFVFLIEDVFVQIKCASW